MAAPPPPHPAVLIGDLVEEFLLRLPPEDPAVLARAALVSRQWHRVVTGLEFHRRFRGFHRSPPLLGYIANVDNSIRFVPLSSFRPRHAELRDVTAVHSSHGRVLLRRYTGEQDLNLLLCVWDPMTNELRDLPRLPLTLDSYFRTDWDAAVICAGGDGCNHIHCHFKVVAVVRSCQWREFSCVYSSEDDSWSDPIFTYGVGCFFITGSCIHVGSALYFRSASDHEIFKYDLLTNKMWIIYVMVEGDVGNISMPTVLIATEDGRLGVAKTSKSTLHLRLLDEHGRWEETRHIEFHTLLPVDALRDPVLPLDLSWDKPRLAGFAKTRAGVIFLRTRVGYFAVDLNSGTSKNVGKCLGWGCNIIPFVSFCTPAPGAVINDEGPGAAVAVSNDEGPGADVVVVSTDEGLETSICPVHKKLKLK